MPRPSKPCPFAGCDVITHGTSGYCAIHLHIAHPCAVTGCPNRVAAHSRSRCCKDHKLVGERIRRKRERPWKV